MTFMIRRAALILLSLTFLIFPGCLKKKEIKGHDYV